MHPTIQPLHIIHLFCPAENGDFGRIILIVGHRRSWCSQLREEGVRLHNHGPSQHAFYKCDPPFQSWMLELVTKHTWLGPSQCSPSIENPQTDAAGFVMIFLLQKEATLLGTGTNGSSLYCHVSANYLWIWPWAQLNTQQTISDIAKLRTQTIHSKSLLWGRWLTNWGCFCWHQQEQVNWFQAKSWQVKTHS